MARIRSIHPGLTKGEAYMEMTMQAKAAWPNLWMHCDDQGVFEWKPKRLKAEIFPSDNIDMETILNEFEALDCVKKFTVDGKLYGAVRNFRKYQRPKKANSVHPLPPELRKYVFLDTLSSEEVPPKLPIGTVKPIQMEEILGEMDDVGCIKKGVVTASPAPSKIDADDLAIAVIQWNDMAGDLNLSAVSRLTEPRKKSLRLRISEIGGIENWVSVLAKIRESPFLRGDNDRGWKADFDFLLQAKSFTKLMEGGYAGNRNNSKPQPRSFVEEALNVGRESGSDALNGVHAYTSFEDL